MTIPQDYNNFSWRCHVCDRERLNSRISVARHVHVFPDGIEVTHHVRYCNDTEYCIQVARHNDHVGIALLRARAKLERRARWWWPF